MPCRFLGRCGLLAIVAVGLLGQGRIAAAQEAAVVPSLSGEDWDVYYIQGARVGYGSTTRRELEIDGAKFTETSSRLHMSIKRLGETAKTDVAISTQESTSGRLVRFSSELRMGAVPIVVRGQVRGDVLEILTESAGRTSKSSLPWKPECLGFFGLEQSLRGKPMKAGERRTLRVLQPVFNQLADVELVAKDLEKTDLPGGPRELLRIDATTRLSAASEFRSTIWTDAQGEALKQAVPLLDQVTYRTTKAVALAKAETPALDLNLSTIVRLEQPLADPLSTKARRYRVKLADADPAKSFIADESQQVRSLDDRTIELTVSPRRADTPLTPSKPAATPSDDERRASSLIQSDDPRVVAMAAKGAENERDPSKVAHALEKLVHDQVKNKNYSQAFASAAEVARKLEGDCTEHAVLLAALLRARGIPSRVAVGVVYVPELQGFAYHMWTEALVGGRWLGLDGTLGRGGTTGAHLKIATSSMKDSAAFESLLSVVGLLGKVSIVPVE